MKENIIKEKIFNPGDKVFLRTKEKEYTGNILESYDSEIILLKLETGYNIGIRENEILDAKILEKAKEQEKFKLEEKISKKNEKLPNIAMIITGGTISSRLDPKSGGVKWTSVKDLFEIAPEIEKICNITKIERPFMKGSEDLDSKDWREIAKICEKLLNDKEIDGLIITHGTDTLHFTSSALAFFLQNLNKPVALTYSQRSIDRASTDAALNLICSAKYAISEIAEVAIIGHENESDETCLAMPATKTRKMHSSRRDAFKIVNSEPIARISREKFEILREFNAKDKNKKCKLDAKFEDKISLVKIYPGQNPDILEFYEKNGYKGLVLEVTGLGHVPSHDAKFNWLPKIKKLVDKGIIVCATPQTIYGRLNPKVYSNGRELEKTGIIFLEDMLSETAFVKLGWVLGHKEWKTKEKIKQKMLENFVGELNERIEE